MNIANFQKSYTPHATASISTWIDMTLSHTERANLYKYFRWACVKAFNSGKYGTNLVAQLRDKCPTRVPNKSVAAVELNNLFLIAMIKWEREDSQISLNFKTNCYNARLTNFLNELFKALAEIDELNDLN